jgi:hypothetical protein
MLMKGKLLLSAAAILTHAAAAAIEEIPESKEVSSADAAGGERELYGPESRYNGARTYDEAQKYTSARVRTVYKDSNGAEYIFRYKSGQRHKVWISGHDDTDTKPTSKPSSYTATYTTDEHTGTYKGKVYTDEAGNYVYRFRDGVRNKVYVNEPGWDGGGRGYRERTGEKTRPKNDSWSPPTPTWSPTKWKPGIPYAGNYNFNYKQPSSPEPTMVPTWEHDGHGRAYGNCVEVSFIVICVPCVVFRELYSMHTGIILIQTLLLALFILSHLSHSNHLVAVRKIITPSVKSKHFARNSAVTTKSVAALGGVMSGSLAASLPWFLPGTLLLMMIGAVVLLNSAWG